MDNAKGKKRTGYGLIMATYLLGIFMGAIDTGIVSPARNIIQNSLGVDDKTGIWMITIYTLAYAASIPIMGKLADKFGRKYVYLTSIFFFGLGSLFCGLSQSTGSFELLLAARVIQAIGGGGIVPIATAEFGTTFPPEKRGMALGLVGGVFGIANILGSTAGSAILDIFGNDRWEFIFYINLPITVFILIAGFLCLQNNKTDNVKKIDIWGILVLTVMVLSLLYGLKSIDFFNFLDSVKDKNVYPFVLLFVLLLPLFIFIEKRVEDPILNLSYFCNSRIIITLILSFITGLIIMGMIFIPQFCENSLKVPTGKGGYFVLILSVFSGIGAPFSGKLIDKFGVKPILAIGFIASAAGSVFIYFVAASNPSIFTVVTSLVLIGLGVGFIMGTPINYMMLDNTKTEESNSALAACSLVRSIGTAIAPAILVGFVAHAGMLIQPNIMNRLPTQVSVSPLPYAKELDYAFEKLKTDEKTKDRFKDINVPKLADMQSIEINMKSDSGYKIPDDLLAMMKSSDVTTIVENSKTLSSRMFAEMTPGVIIKIQSGIGKGIDGINSGIHELEKNISDLEAAYDGIGKGIAGQEQAVTRMVGLKTMIAALPAGTFNGKISADNLLPPAVKEKMPASVIEMLKNVYTMEDIDNIITDIKSSLDNTKKQQSDIVAGIEGMKKAKEQMQQTLDKMTVVSNAVPAAFESGKINYLKLIDEKKIELETEYQQTLNGGFRQVYLTIGISSLAALFILMFYVDKRKLKNN